MTTGSPKFRLHTAYVMVWEVVTIKASLHNNKQCGLGDEVDVFNVPSFERLCSIQEKHISVVSAFSKQ